MKKLVLLRHGESTWNRENRFTGWTDVDLSPTGIQQAIGAAKLLNDEGFKFDVAYTSVLKRAIRTLWLVLDGTDRMWIPVIRSWRLNERHYGALQGLNKTETAAKFGEAQVHQWRRGYATLPPPLEPGDERHPQRDERYESLPSSKLPTTESLEMTVARVMPFWDTEIAPTILEDSRVIIAAHGNSLRALVKHLDKLSDEEVSELNIPTGVPLVYELDDDLSPIKHYYLGDEKAIQAAIDAVAAQGEASAN